MGVQDSEICMEMHVVLHWHRLPKDVVSGHGGVGLTIGLGDLSGGCILWQGNMRWLKNRLQDLYSTLN